MRAGDARGTSVLLTAATTGAALVAGRAVASEFGRDLFRIDLGRIVAAFAGETEKNLDCSGRGPPSLFSVE